MAPRAHDKATHVFFLYLLRRGHRIAWEVGVPGGRIDLVRVDDTGRWVELYEVKLRNPEQGIAQLVRYGSVVDGDLALTLVVPLGVSDQKLRNAAEARGVSVRTFDFDRFAHVRSAGRGWIVCLPTFSEEALARISAAASEFVRRAA